RACLGFRGSPCAAPRRDPEPAEARRALYALPRTGVSLPPNAGAARERGQASPSLGRGAPAPARRGPACPAGRRSAARESSPAGPSPGRRWPPPALLSARAPARARATRAEDLPPALHAAPQLAPRRGPAGHPPTLVASPPPFPPGRAIAADRWQSGPSRWRREDAPRSSDPRRGTRRAVAGSAALVPNRPRSPEDADSEAAPPRYPGPRQAASRRLRPPDH